MEKETKEIIKLTTKEILRYLENQTEVVISALDVGLHPMAKILHPDYPTSEEVDWKDLKRKIQRLKQRGLIRKNFENKKYYLEITQEGKDLLKRSDFYNLRVERPAIWDKKWRIVIYDIPENNHLMRDKIRNKLYQIGFVQVQKSVFVYPFECTEVINVICARYGEKNSIKYLIADIIEGEESITETFLDKKVLTSEDLV